MRRPERRFYFRLCALLGFAHPDHLLRCLTSRQLAEWEAYASLEPIGEDKEDLRFSLLMAVMENCHRGRNDPVSNPERFMRMMSRLPIPEQTPEEQWQTLQQFKRR